MSVGGATSVTEDEIGPDLRSAFERGDRVVDAAFDAIYPAEVRRVSDRYWTPVDVARLACQWFDAHGGSRVLDIGSGAGKFCLVGALTTDLSFVGVEHRADLVDVARSAAQRLALGRRATFVHASFADVDVADHDCLYLYNPFLENLYERDARLDSRVELHPGRFAHDIRAFERALDVAPIGTQVITYFGFGGRIPSTYTFLASIAFHGDSLLHYRKVAKVHRTERPGDASEGAVGET